MDEDEEAAQLPENKLTEQQKGELRACFDSFDEDGSGFLCARHACPHSITRACRTPCQAGRGPWRAVRLACRRLSHYL